MAKKTASPSKPSSKAPTVKQLAEALEAHRRVLQGVGDYLRTQRGQMVSDRAAACDAVLAEIDKL